jgi:hypothetical protein
VTSFDFLSLKKDVNVPSKRINRKLSVFGILEVNDENSRIQIQDPDPLVRSPDPYKNVMDPQQWA